MTQEEKARAYDEALSVARKTHQTQPMYRDWLEKMFPELAESEDERIRKGIISAIKEDWPGHADWIAWLEKQCEQKPVIKMKTPEESLGIDSDTYNKIVDECVYGEQKPIKEHNACEFCEDRYGCVSPCSMKLVEEEKYTDNVEPKFHKGEWVVTDKNNVVQIKAIENGKYVLENTMRFSVDYVDRSWREWDISDAKEGDVLACPNDAGDRDVVFIFKNINSEEGLVFCFCASDANDCFCTNNDYVGNSNSTNIYPATKEQRDTLFAKMKDAGYTFDFDKKELKKIEQKSIKTCAEYYNKDRELKMPVLSEFQDKLADILMHREYDGPDETEDDIAKGRLEYELAAIRLSEELLPLAQKEQKPAWSEEDEKMFEHIIAKATLHFSSINYLDEEEINFLKSLRLHSQWKPSEAQMTALNYVINLMASSESALENDYYYNVFKDLREQLKKLKE